MVGDVAKATMQPRLAQWVSYPGVVEGLRTLSQFLSYTHQNGES